MKTRMYYSWKSCFDDELDLTRSCEVPPRGTTLYRVVGSEKGEIEPAEGAARGLVD